MQKSFKDHAVNLVHTLNEFGIHFLKTAVSCWYWTHGMLWTGQ